LKRDQETDRDSMLRLQACREGVENSLKLAKAVNPCSSRKHIITKPKLFEKERCTLQGLLERAGDQCVSRHFGTRPLLFEKTDHDHQESEP